MAQYRFIGDPREGGRGAEPLEILGLSFTRDDWTTVPDGLVGRLDNHSHLERRPETVKEPKAEAPSEDAVTVRGAAAKAAGKPRTVPPAYRSKPEAARWLAGYDNA